ncbi:ATP-grasp domain-containing protein [Hymenobacter mellowenesis]|uniref:ATP-grasp domain-containing protein n=1 Tax=Hymenobacter mellowenesis TaxID=3063995 RepID=UPI003F7972D8
MFTLHGKSVPPPLNIPKELEWFAGRTIEESTLGEFQQDTRLPIFLKPRDTCKLFTGGVITSQSSKLFLFDCPPETPILISPVVDFQSEYRVFVSRRKGIETMRHYLGDPFLLPDKEIVEWMMESYTTSPVCYSLDVGGNQVGRDSDCGV